jgi:hypothetical protein
MMNIEDLINTINQEKRSVKPSHKRYPIRFLLLNNYKDLRYLINNLQIEILSLSDLEVFKKDPDSWITKSEIINLLKNLNPGKDFIVLSISEFVRFLSDDEFYSIMSSFMEIENTKDNPNRRIYIPLVGITNKFINIFWEKYHRRQEIEAFWKIKSEEEKYNIYFVNFLDNVEVENYHIIKNSKEFLNIWKEELPKSSNILCISKTLNLYSDKIFSDEIFNIFKIKNFKEYLKLILNIHIPFEYDERDKTFWNKLLPKISKKRAFNFYEFVEDFINVKRVDPINFLNLWFKNEDFGCWLLKNYIISKKEYENTYVLKVLNSVEGYEKEEILYKYYSIIFDEKIPKKELLEERRKTLINLLEEKKDWNLNFTKIDKFLEEKSKELPPDKFKIYLTGTTLYEKKWIIENIEKIENLTDLYPELAHYLNDVNYKNITPEQSWIVEYFKEYRFSRLKDTPNEKLLETLNEKNKNEESFYNWYYSFKKVDYYLKNDLKKFWIDALSLEFLPLIVRLLEEKGYNVDFDIAVSNLPTTTEFNKFEGIERIDDLDNFIHDRPTKTAFLKLIQEIEIVKKIIEKILIKDEKEFIIISDHGFTAFANKNIQKQKIPHFKVIESNVRYGILEKNIELNIKEDLITHKADNRSVYVIALKYTSFSYPSSLETHGGATPEEVLVPVIYAYKTTAEDIEFPYEIEIINPEISIRNPILYFRIIPKPTLQIVVKYKGKSLQTFYVKEKNYYQIDLSDFNPGSYELIFLIGNHEKKEKIIIKGGIKEQELL